MDERWRVFFYVLGILFAIYLLFWYIIPVVFKMLGCVIGITLKIIIWGAVVLILLFFVGYVIRRVRN